MRQRSAQRKLEVGDNRRLTFYSAVFDEFTQVYDYKPGERVRSRYTEVIRPGAFTAALSGPSEVIANIDHDDGRAFARRSDGSLLMQQDPHGLFCSAWVPETPLGDGILRDVQAGVITGCSFRFSGERDAWTGNTCEILSLDLEDVCVTASPQYEGTEVHLRSKAYLREILARYAYAKFRAKR